MNGRRHIKVLQLRSRQESGHWLAGRAKTGRIVVEEFLFSGIGLNIAEIPPWVNEWSTVGQVQSTLVDIVNNYAINYRSERRISFYLPGSAVCIYEIIDY